MATTYGLFEYTNPTYRTNYMTSKDVCRLCGDTGVVACLVVPKFKDEDDLAGIRPCVCSAGLGVSAVLARNPAFRQQLDSLIVGRSETVTNSRLRKTYVIWSNEDITTLSELQLRYVSADEVVASISFVFDEGVGEDEGSIAEMHLEVESDQIKYLPMFADVIQGIMNLYEGTKASRNKSSILDVVTQFGFSYEFSGQEDAEEDSSSWSDAASQEESVESIFEDLPKEGFADWKPVEREKEEEISSVFRVTGTPSRALDEQELAQFQKEIGAVCARYGVKI